MTGRELMAQLAALPPEDLDLPVCYDFDGETMGSTEIKKHDARYAYIIDGRSDTGIGKGPVLMIW